MKELQEAIQKLKDLQQSSKGSYVGANDEIGFFLKFELQSVIDNLEDVQNGLSTKNDHSSNCSH